LSILFPKSPTSKTKILSNVDITNPSCRGHFNETLRSKKDEYVNAYNHILLKKMES